MCNLIIKFLTLGLRQLRELRTLQLAFEVKDLGANLLHVNLQPDVFFGLLLAVVHRLAESRRREERRRVDRW